MGEAKQEKKNQRSEHKSLLMNREPQLLKCCNESLSLVLVYKQTKDSFGKGEDMEMHHGEMHCLSLCALQTFGDVTVRTAERTMKRGFECFFKQPFHGRPKHQRGVTKVVSSPKTRDCRLLRGH